MLYGQGARHTCEIMDLIFLASCSKQQAVISILQLQGFAMKAWVRLCAIRDTRNAEQPMMRPPLSNHVATTFSSILAPERQ